MELTTNNRDPDSVREISFEGVLVLKRADWRITGNNNRIIGLGFV